MIGKQIAHYEVLSKLGEGGMGAVYRARDTRLDREVALKVLPPEFARDPERLARFRREARVLASLNHPHIAALHGLEEANGETFLAMELVEGEELAERMARGAVDLDDALDLARQLAEGLESAHEQGIVHRDLKPANIKVTPDGQLKILDFGLARAYLGDPDESGSLEHSPTITAALTGHGVILGTAAYMSPEQARGKRIDHRTDIWAFGVILFEMLSGTRLFKGETISDTMAAVLRADPPWDDLPADTPHGVRRLLERCLERDSRRRLRDIGEARVRLERWREDPTSLDQSYGHSYEQVETAARRFTVLPWALCGVIALVAVGLGWRLLNQPEPQPRRLHLALDILDKSELQGSGITASISPDGKWVAWNTTAGIHLRDLRDATTTLLRSTEGATLQCFSPDSQWIAFNARGQLLRVNVGGGAPIEICESPTPRGFTWVDQVTLVMAPNISSGLQIVDLRNGSVKELSQIDTAKGERSHRWPTVVPGQRAVLFECQFLGRDYDESDVRYLSLDTGKMTTVYRGGGAPTATGHGQVLFVRDNALFALDWDRKGSSKGGLAIPVLEDLSSSVGNQENDDGSAQYSLDGAGTLLYLDHGENRSSMGRLVWYDYSNGETRPIGPLAQQGFFQLAPDGVTLAVERERDRNSNIYVLNSATGEENMLTRRESVEYLGAFSPDSSVLYWSQGSEDGTRFEIWRRPVDGSAPAEFVVAAPNQAGLWPNSISPDGRDLLVSAWMGADRRDILTLDLEDIDAGFQPFAGGPDEQDNAVWFGSDLVLYLEGAAGSASLVMRRFPDTGAVWTLPDQVPGYWSGAPIENQQAVLGINDIGMFRIPLARTSDAVRPGKAKMVHKWTAEEVARLRVFQPLQTGTVGVTIEAEESVGDSRPARLVLITGWVQQVAEELQRRSEH